MARIAMRADTSYATTALGVQDPHFRKQKLAIYHFTSKIIGRNNYNTVSALAYRTGTNLCSVLTGERSDYSAKDVAHVELLCAENQLHWRLDVTFNEDKGCIRNENASENMDILRKWALNILNKAKANPHQSLKSVMRKNRHVLSTPHINSQEGFSCVGPVFRH